MDCYWNSSQNPEVHFNNAICHHFAVNFLYHFHMQEKINFNNSAIELEKDLQNKDRQNVSLSTVSENVLNYEYTQSFQEPVEMRFLLSAIPVHPC